MQTSRTFGIELLTAGMMMLGIAQAQQTPAATTTQPASGQTTAAPASGTTAKAPASAAKKPATPAGTAAGATKKAVVPLVLKTDKEKQSYALGMNLGTGLHRQGIVLDPALVARGVRDAQAGGKTAMTEDEERAALTQLQTSVRQKMEVKSKEEGASNRKEGDAFLAANKSKEGIVTLPDGLQYKILKEGTGPKPAASDTVSCNYRGTLLNGKEFDASSKHGGPISFQVGGVIKGWTEALQLMPVGSKWQLFIPADLAYGDHPPQGGDLAPGDTLVFDVELVSIMEQKK
jgi:FKBP-type peptidyl-prolyl cis-trans isomerase FklB